MKIIITEAQYSKLTEDNLREFLYAFWDRQKKNGEEPFLDEMLYHVLGMRKNSREANQQVLPIWYEYNGGRVVLYDKLVDDINEKTFRLQDDAQNLNADFKVVGFDGYELGDEGKPALYKHAKALEADRDHYKQQLPWVGYASTAYQLSIVLLSASILSVSMALFWSSFVLAGAGVFLMLQGILLFL